MTRALLIIAAATIFCVVASSAEPRAKPNSASKLLATYAPAPKVPAEAKARHLAGAGVCVVYVRPDGTVWRAEMLKSTGQRLLDQASIEAFSKWRFIPGTVTKVKIPINYTGNYTKPPKT